MVEITWNRILTYKFTRNSRQVPETHSPFHEAARPTLKHGKRKYTSIRLTDNCISSKELPEQYPFRPFVNIQCSTLVLFGPEE
jgi:hypothetical protein